MRTIGHEQIKRRECGNTVILAHADGFESIYCHLQRGSLRVKPGDTVKREQDLGRAGLSGNTEFAYLHFALCVEMENLSIRSPTEPLMMHAVVGLRFVHRA